MSFCSNSISSRKFEYKIGYSKNIWIKLCSTWHLVFCNIEHGVAFRPIALVYCIQYTIHWSQAFSYWWNLAKGWNLNGIFWNGNIERWLKICASYLACSQIWLKLPRKDGPFLYTFQVPMDDCYTGCIRKFLLKKH
jgi:hypothetical protein